MLDYNPQPIDLLQLRYPDAVMEIFEVSEVLAGFVSRPGELQKHVFDFNDGLRLIISRERLPAELPIFGRQIVLHISASFIEKTTVHGRLDALARESVAAAIEWFKKEAIERWQYVAMSRERPTFIGLSNEKQCPHWHLPEYREPSIH